MTKTIMILAIAAAFVAGSIATGTVAFAGDDEDDDDGDSIVSSGSSVYKVSATISVPAGSTTSVVAEAPCDIGDVILQESLALEGTGPPPVEPFVVAGFNVQTPLRGGPGTVDLLLPDDRLSIGAFPDGTFSAFTFTASAFCLKATP